MNRNISVLSACLAMSLTACVSTEAPSNQKKLVPNTVTYSQAINWPQQDGAFCHAALDKATEQLDNFRQAYTDPLQIPRSFSQGKPRLEGPMGWTAGFVAGSYWYVYEHNRNQSWLDTATEWTEALEPQQFNRRTHDIGFIINSTFGNGQRLTGKKAYEPVQINAAKTFMERYNPKIGTTFSWSWGTWEFPVIIDNMMNLELLFNASLATGDQTYYDAAVSHATVTMEHHFRDDHSSYHLVNYNRTTGLPNFKQTFQGIADDSSWARGQGWGLYGYTMVYRFTKDEKFLNHARNIANYILTHKNMPDDLVPYFDYDAPDDPNIVNYRDSSAASLAASALLELATYVEGAESQRYHQAAMKMLRSLSSPAYLAGRGENGHFLLKQATGNYPAVDELNSALNYGDYYYLEALTRCKTLAK
ncbi:glucuronyl hydrolase [Saccharobesus litoralis]|uniref:Glucuronyl hydrolase n=1 Tax=Saccharobesus litoralis TaxID=2172099 RepID=A0A2S0VN26_9ALTE|nr:glycoside hydrolase family 88 protein [Saccharobesus litoralis]AWB65606.1 glucuronyl hydrolase [Saccharobesus litoralis]